MTIVGLQSKPELNGFIGTVLGPDHSAQAASGYQKGRVPVLVQGRRGAPLLLKPETLELRPAGGEDEQNKKLGRESLGETQRPRRHLTRHARNRRTLLCLHTS